MHRLLSQKITVQEIHGEPSDQRRDKFTTSLYKVKVKVKVKLTTDQAMNVHMGSRCILLLLLLVIGLVTGSLVSTLLKTYYT